jgi:hypothetical protein
MSEKPGKFTPPHLRLRVNGMDTSGLIISLNQEKSRSGLSLPGQSDYQKTIDPGEKAKPILGKDNFYHIRWRIP